MVSLNPLFIRSYLRFQWRREEFDQDVVLIPYLSGLTFV